MQDRKKTLFGVGMFWPEWRGSLLPEKYKDDPQRYWLDQMDLAVELGATCIPIGLGWISVEPERGAFRWDESDRIVEEATKRNLEIFAYIGHTPDWAVPVPEDGTDKLPGYRTPPDESFVDEFTHYCASVASRYRDTVRQFSFWNEPNGCSWIQNGCSNMGGFPLYTKWLKRAYTALKAEAPGALISAGSLDYNAGVPAGWLYVQGIYDEGGKDYFDAIDIHPYAPRGVHWQAVHDTRRVMVENGDADKPIWISEYGWEHPDDEQACEDLTEFLNIIRRKEYAFVTHTRYLVVTDLNEGLYGLTDIDLAKRPVFEAFKQVPKEELPAANGKGIPGYALPFDLRRPGTAADNSGEASRFAITGAKNVAEYNEGVLLSLEIPQTNEKLVDIRWYIDSKRVDGARERFFEFAQKPDRERSYTVRAEVDMEDTEYTAQTTIRVREYAGTEFKVLLESPPKKIAGRIPVTVTTRTLNKSSHDLTYRWYVDNTLVEGAMGADFTVHPESLEQGVHQLRVHCTNASFTSEDTTQIEVTHEQLSEAETDLPQPASGTASA